MKSLFRVFNFGVLVVLTLSFAVLDTAAKRPNVLMICVDDLNDWVGCLGGHPQVKTPNIDSLAERGLLFENAHCAAPVCNPSRLALLSGLDPTTTGVYGNSSYWPYNHPSLLTIPRQFKSHGYRVEGGGKVFHHTPGHNPPDQWHYFFKQRWDDPYHRYPAGSLKSLGGWPKPVVKWPEGFPLNGLENVRNPVQSPPGGPREFDWGPLDKGLMETGDGRAVAWADQFLDMEHTDPFFLAVGIFRPHLPWYAPEPYFDMYPLDEIVMPILKEDDLDDLPESGKQMAQSSKPDFDYLKSQGRYPEAVQAYLASISMADALLGELLKSLNASAYATNTIIVLWSDHGWHLGEKEHWHKFTLWERSTRVPFIVVAPGKTTPGQRSSRPVGLIDIFPTLNELCGLDPVEGLDGISLVPLLENPNRVWDRPALTTHGPGNYSVRSQDFRYIRYRDGGEELYDHRSDPNEWNNLAADPQFADLKATLSKRMPVKATPQIESNNEVEFDPWAFTFRLKKVEE
ncbi:MAG: sulfatase [Verrucomicrobia bacterium]|nr:sulfatase [Verrucomicrobiota bacterium]MDA1067322.1 sulfatase [Verrucomicrobiota bacterium]